MFRYPIDRLPITIFLCISLVDFSLYLWCDNIAILVAYWLLMIVPKGKICAWNHHHQHKHTFKKKYLNRMLEFIYGLHTGVTTNLWVLHHVLGHHQNYLDQSLDQSRWKRKDGSTMGEIEYTFNVASTAYYRGYLMGKNHPKPQRDFLLYGSITALVVLTLVVIKPIPGLLLFVLPMVTGLLLTCWATYEHHTGLDTDNEFEASRNNLHPIYNLMTGNLGYHTAHHHKQGVHWSLLPELHKTIEHKIPAHLYKNSWL